MFGLTKREQHWAAQERCAKMLVDLTALALQVRLAEANAEEARRLAEAAKAVSK
jgi:hypothetical protein